MRALNIVRLSVATIVPFGLLVANGANSEAGNSKSPVSNKPNLSADRATSANSSVVTPPKPIAAPETVPIAAAPPVTSANSLPVIQVAKHPQLSQTLAVGKATFPKASSLTAVSQPENLGLSWDSIIERSAGIRLSPMTAPSRVSEPTQKPSAEASSEPTQKPSAEASSEPSSEPSSEEAAAKASNPPEPIAPSLVENAANASPTPAIAAPQSTESSETVAQAPLPTVAVATPEATSAPESISPTTPSPEVTSVPESTPPTTPSPEVTSAPIAPPTRTALHSAIPSPETTAPIQSPQVTPAANQATPVANTVSNPTGIRLNTGAQNMVAQRTVTQNGTAQNTLVQNTVAQVDERYALDAGDTLRIDVFNVPEYSGEYRVLADGTLNLPAVGSVSVAGQTLQQAQETIATQYGRELRNIRITVSLINARPLQVGVVGEVGQPGLYTLGLTGNSQFPTVAQAIQTAGGATQAADLRQVIIRRTKGATPQEIQVNLWELLRNGDLSQNLALRDGDTIMVRPSANVDLAETSQLASSNLATNNAEAVDVALVGEVARPGAYKLGGQSASSRPTLTEAIQVAGGITSLADIRQVEVRRQTRSGTEQAFKVDLWQVVQAGDLNQDVILQRGDRIVIPTAQALSREESVRLAASNIAPSQIKVSIVGEVENPGSVEIPSGSTLNQAVLSAGGLNRRARRTVALIRLNPNGSLTREEIKVNLRDGSDEAANPLLQNNDIVVVGRTGLASFSDTLSDVLNPLFRLVPLTNLF